MPARAGCQIAERRVGSGGGSRAASVQSPNGERARPPRLRLSGGHMPRQRVETVPHEADESVAESALQPVSVPAGEAGVEPRDRHLRDRDVGPRRAPLRRHGLAVRRSQRRARGGGRGSLSSRLRVQGPRLAPPLRSARASAGPHSRRRLRRRQRHRRRPAGSPRRRCPRRGRPPGDERSGRRRPRLPLPLHAGPGGHRSAHAACRYGSRNRRRVGRRTRGARGRRGRRLRCGRRHRRPSTPDRERTAHALPPCVLARRAGDSGA